ncbi:hypothetical protein [uncultured Chitinophaga sp.]|uniref:hypothetical protein n=1 Tax=uncultured Chitinophaga sp. TaxID=339340 RepID=UPI0025E17CE5|nr:hypothetical protein [uncultured Chitinophaga sp.]
MKKGKEIAEELKGLAPGMPVPDMPAYSIPDGYFDALPGMIMQRVMEEQHPVSSVQEELDEISPFLAAVPRHTPYSAPAGYFESLELPVAITADKKESGRVVTMAKRVKLLKRGLAAACIAAVISVGGVYLTNEYNPGKIDQQLAALSDTEIEEYLQNHTDDFDTEAIFSTVSYESELPSVLDEVSTDALEEFVDENMIKDVN